MVGQFARRSVIYPWLDPRGRFSAFKAAVFASLFLPALWVLYLGWTEQLGARPVMEAIHQLGLWAIRLLFLSLAVTPLRGALRWPNLLQIRRMLGVACFCYAFAHFLGYGLDQAFDLGKIASEIVLRLYLTIGFVALVALGILTATSTDGMVRRLGGRPWRRLHQAIYAVAALACVHYFMQSKLGVNEPVVVGGLYLWLMGFRIVSHYRRQAILPVWVLGAISLSAALLTLIGETGFFAIFMGVDPWRIIVATLTFTPAIRPCWYVLWIGLAVTLAAALRVPRSKPKREAVRPARAA
ncbi:MAG TPA: protein-methionine-sulfoxide reductase heme-binding subunit MsrQ [Aliidongia sp.]|nr:protein-methionine-sulfoxide reductase heme-binding subunit MsrQ [Aliidongia sp.]